MAATAATDARQAEDREKKTHEHHAADASQCSFHQSMQLPSPQQNPWPMGPSLIDLRAAVRSKSSFVASVAV